eukprot:GILJ01008437.1.p1 GENE.GILJ01008437.1~~GILJ01008437.1.p1  ORF type:complete len:266 (+),score=41.03 GILJ01008437.1:33-830(+)
MEKKPKAKQADTSKRKRAVEFLDATLSQQNAPVDPLYAPLPMGVLEANVKKKLPVMTEPDGVKFVDKFVKDIVKNHNQNSVDSIVNAKLAGKALLLDNPQTAFSLEAAQQKKRQRDAMNEKRMGVRERKSRSMYNIEEQAIKYELFVPLHQLWVQYMQDLIGTTDNELTICMKLLKADLHGAVIKVIRSRIPSYVGMCGIVVQETEHAFKLITSTNSIKLILKAGTVFTLQLGSHVVTLYGEHLQHRSAERSKIKWKHKPTVEIK